MARVPAAFGGTADRPFPAVLWIAAAISLVAALSPRDLWAPDEPRAGVVARAMVEDGHWLVPHMNGQPYPEKPPFVYWLMSVAGILLGGVSAVAARLPGALATACAVFSVARLARRWFGDASMGDTAALLFATTELILWNGSRAGLDLPMTAFVLLAIEAGSAVVAKKSVPGAIGFGVALGLGMLSKGPHVLFVPIAALVGGCMAVHASRRLLDPLWLLAWLVAAGIVFAWALPAMAEGGQTYRDRLLGQIGDRLSGENVPHEHPWWHLPPLLLAVGLPWTVTWFSGLSAAWRFGQAAQEDRFGLGACLAGVLAPLVVLSVPASKRDLYLIPLLPLLALAAAYGLHRFPSRRLHRWGVRVAVVLLVVLGFGAIAAPFVSQTPFADAVEKALPGVDLGGGSLPFAFGAIALLAAVGAFAGLRLLTRPVAAARVVAIAFGAVWLVASTAILPAFDDTKTFARAAAIAERVQPKADLMYDRDAIGDDPSTLLWSFHRSHATSFSRLLHLTGPPMLIVYRADSPVGYSSTMGFTNLELWRGRVGGRTYVLETNVSGR